jgi:ATP-dependent protease ClpP protease subunit
MSELEIAEGQTKTDLTSTQKETGQYTKGKVILKGIPITIENPKGSTRSGYSKNGIYWKSKLNYTYGYIDDSVGSDGDEIDIFLGPLSDTEQTFWVYIINQIDPLTGIFDEHKIMFGFVNYTDAKAAYLSCYEQGWKGLGSMEQISLNGFMSWVKKQSNEIFINQLNPVKNEVVKGNNESMKLIKLEGEVFLDKTLLDLQQQAGDLKGVKTLVISIGSPGGDVSEGIRIMMWFDYLSSIGIKIVTLVVSNAYSIASLIMLAADHILIAKDADVMVHNPMIPDLQFVNANELEAHVKDLRELESTMYELYEVFTDLTTDKIKELMDNETYISASEAVRYGFADEIANIEKRPKVMAISKLKPVNMKKTLNILNQVIALVGNKPIVNQSYYDSKGGEIEIFQQDPSCYTAGDRTSVESGQVKLQDGSILNIKDFIIESIDKSAPVSTDATEPVVPVVTEPSQEIPVPVTASFNEGPVPVVEAPVESKPTEMKTEVTKTETTKTEPVAPVAVIHAIEAPVVEPVAVEPVAPVTTEPAPVVEASKEGESETIVVPLKEFQDLVANYKALSETVANLVKGQGQVTQQMKESSRFEEIATEAIEMIAKNTTSNFRPAAKAIVGEEPKGSIFAQAKQRVQATQQGK